MQNCAELVRRIATPLLDELHVTQKVVADHFTRAHSKGLTADLSTSTEDCLALYTLIRHFNRQHVFEIGTNIGSTAIAMYEAASRNGGVCTTCDPIDYKGLPYWNSIRFINSGSSLALRTLYEEGHSLDFMFIDWVPDKHTLEMIPKTCTGHTIFAVHDYAINSKGQEIIDTIVASPEFDKRHGTWFIPDAAPIDVSGIKLNAATAFFIPSVFL